MKKEEVIILNSDDTAAKKITLTGWVSRNGRFYGENEELARFDGSTHAKCDCGNIMTKGWLKCDACRGKAAMERYNAYKYEEWDGVTPVFDNHSDRYFFNADEIEEYLEDEGLEADDLILELCEPNYAKSIDSSIWEDELPEDGDIPKELQQKIDELNEYIKTLPPLSYSPCKIRTSYIPSNE